MLEKDLYSYWGKFIHEKLRMEFQIKKWILMLIWHLKSILKQPNPNQLNACIVSPIFKDEKKRNFKIIVSIRARGMMASYQLKIKFNH